MSISGELLVEQYGGGGHLKVYYIEATDGYIFSTWDPDRGEECIFGTDREGAEEVVAALQAKLEATEDGEA